MSALDFLDDLSGQRIPGGCPDCDAYQTVDPVGDQVYRLTVHHDETCPSFRAMNRRTA